jgi:hypothetical protein
LEAKSADRVNEGNLSQMRLMIQLKYEPSIEFLSVLLCDSHDNFGIFILNMEHQMDYCEFEVSEDFDDRWESALWVEKLEEDAFFRALHGFRPDGYGD